MRGTKLRGISLALGVWGLCATLGAVGCDVFDEGLIVPEGAAGTGGAGSKPELKIAEDISCSAPENASFNDYHEKADIANARADRSKLPGCLGGEDAPGADAFFSVSMNQGDKWHFHVEQADGYDPAVYVMESCNNTDTCASRLSGINACGENVGEHFSFIAPRSGRFVVGVDSLTQSTGGMRVLAVNARCGNGVVEHSEYCDTALEPTAPLYKADCKACRKLIPDGGDDAGSSNDGPLDSAILDLPNPLVPGRDFKFTGSLEKRCDFDFFSFDLEESATVRVKLESGDGCVGWDVRVDEEDRPFQVDPSDEDACPDILLDLERGRHEIRVVAGPELEASAPGYEVTLTFNEDALAGG